MIELLQGGDFVLGGLLLIVLIFGFAPGFMLRLLVKIYPREDPRRAELIAQIYLLRRVERPFYVAEQLETVLFEGLPHRVKAWKKRGSKPRRRRYSERRRPEFDVARSVVRRIVVTTMVGAMSFPIADLIFSELRQQLTMAAGVGAVVLLVQILVDLEKRLARAEKAHLTIPDSLQGMAAIHAGTPRLVSAFAQSEVDRISEFLRDLADQQVTHDGEDREWLLGLTRSTTSSLDAINVPEVDATGSAIYSFWECDLGHRYLDLQRDALRRGVRVRRVFVTEGNEPANDPALHRICRIQSGLGIDVRLLNPSAIPHSIRTSLFDFILFDDALSYEVDSAPQLQDGPNRTILHTRLIMHQDKVTERISRYDQIWDAAVPWLDDESWGGGAETYSV